MQSEKHKIKRMKMNAETNGIASKEIMYVSLESQKGKRDNRVEFLYKEMMV